jgi:flavin reductase (DIM6/NTAB) family NADH-FMN oxidoreductase RutF
MTAAGRLSMKKSFGAKTLIYPTPVWVVGTYDTAGRPNLATVAWAGICCSEPPCVAVSLRKATCSYGNIMARKAFTVNVPSESSAATADYLGLASGRDVEKFTEAGLTPVTAEYVEAPYVEEFPLVLECSLLHTFELGLHTQFVGEIRDVKADEEVCTDRGRPDIEKVKPILFGPGAHTYHGIGAFLGKAFVIGREKKGG